ncbi:uncharacterized protein [Nicotiana sylvestris]|uniref:uncharacterized protein n=1 Tax=Nicotiana sylvestris TaxID=4096 RepID=UPI00388C64EB
MTWEDVHNSYQSKTRVEDEQLGAPSGSVFQRRLLAKESENVDKGSRSNKERYHPYVDDRRNISRRNIPRNDRRADRGQSSRGIMSKTKFYRHLGPAEGPRLSEYNFISNASSIILAIGKIRDTRWPKPIQTDPSQGNLNLMCKYHSTNGHMTEDCRQLREEIARLLNEGHLRELLSDRAKNHFRERDANRKSEPEEPQHVMHRIIGGVNVQRGPIFKHSKVSITREKQNRDYMPEDTLTFSEEDIKALSPHNYALVFSILLNKVQVKRVLVNPGSSANIIRSRVVEQVGMLDQILHASRVLNGFNMASEMAVST